MKKPTFHHRHRIRANFYHLGIIFFVVGSLLNYTGYVSDEAYKYFCITLIVLDYLAEMYDPHPDTPGPWFKRHFHRLFEDEEE